MDGFDELGLEEGMLVGGGESRISTSGVFSAGAVVTVAASKSVLPNRTALA